MPQLSLLRRKIAMLQGNMLHYCAMCSNLRFVFLLDEAVRMYFNYKKEACTASIIMESEE